MLDADVLVFVEVRYRSGGRYGDGAASITRAKRRRLTGAARYFLARHPQTARRACRFDVVSVTQRNCRAEFTWIKSAFDAV
jgi:putative endonuclease